MGRSFKMSWWLAPGLLLVTAATTYAVAFDALHTSHHYVLTDAATGDCPTGWSLITSEDKCKKSGINSAKTSKTCQWGAAASTSDSNFRGSDDHGARPHGCWQSSSADGCVYWNPNAAAAVATSTHGRSICAESGKCGPYGCSHRAEYTDRAKDFAKQLASISSTYTGYKSVYDAANALKLATARAVGANEAARAVGEITSMTTPTANATIGGYQFHTHGTNAGGQACEMKVNTGIQICIPCDSGRTRRVGSTTSGVVGGSSACTFGIAMVAVDIVSVNTTNECSRWFLYADAQVRSIATSWQANWIYDRLPPIGKLYVTAQSSTCVSTANIYRHCCLA